MQTVTTHEGEEGEVLLRFRLIISVFVQVPSCKHQDPVCFIITASEHMKRGQNVSEEKAQVGVGVSGVRHRTVAVR